MAEEVAFLVLLRVADLEGHRRPAGIQLRLGSSVGVPRNDIHLRRLAIDDLLLLLGGKFIGISVTRGRIKLISYAARRMIHTVTERHYREDNQSADLNHVDRNSHGR